MTPSPVWPNWYPGKPLKALDLVGMEHHIAERFAYPTGGFGVVKLDEDDIKAEMNEDGSQVIITLEEVKAITQRGQFVHLKHPGAEVVVPVQDSMLIDLAIHVNPISDKTKSEEKFTFVFTTSTNKDDSYAHDIDTVYLGRFTCKISPSRMTVDFELTNLPPLFSLSAINAGTDRFIELTKPLVVRINDLIVGRLQKRPLREFSFAQSVALSEAYFIAFHWAILPIQELVSRLNYLNWLDKILDEESFVLNAGLYLGQSGKEIDIVNKIDSLPERLAGILESVNTPPSIKNILKPLQYEEKWVENGSNKHLEITLKDDFPASEFQIILDFASLPVVPGEYAESIGTMVVRGNDDYVDSPDVVAEKESARQISYRITINEGLDSKSKITLFSICKTKPKVTIKNYKKL